MSQLPVAEFARRFMGIELFPKQVELIEIWERGELTHIPSMVWRRAGRHTARRVYIKRKLDRGEELTPLERSYWGATV